jgi:uncharacterized protein YcbK (DUF882 family)
MVRGTRLLSASVWIVAILYVSCGASVGPAERVAPPIEVAGTAPLPKVAPVPLPVTPAPVDWAVALEPLKVECANSGASDEVRLYADDGSLEERALDAFSHVAADFNGYSPLHRRLIQLVVKAAHHFRASALIVVSGFRQKRGTKGDHHTAGEALDFKLPGVDYRKLAAYLRSFPRVGVGIYTHPKTQYVHLDVRDRSYHWLDASPPGVTWREALLPDPSQARRDASYTPESDLPIEGSE